MSENNYQGMRFTFRENAVVCLVRLFPELSVGWCDTLFIFNQTSILYRCTCTVEDGHNAEMHASMHPHSGLSCNNAVSRPLHAAVVKSTDPGRYSRAVLVNNAGALGHISFANELPSLAKLGSEMDFNVTSALWLSSRFASLFGARRSPSADNGQGSGAVVSGVTCASSNLVVNISSLAAIKPFESWAGYSAGKAARDMFHR